MHELDARAGEVIRIDGKITVTILEVTDTAVRLGIIAPRKTFIKRENSTEAAPATEKGSGSC